MFKSKRNYFLDLKNRGVKSVQLHFSGTRKPQVISHIFDVGETFLFFGEKGHNRIPLEDITKVEYNSVHRHSKTFS
jgi:hypothetical protein